MIQNIKDNLNILILFSAPLFAFLWHLENNHLPMSDAVGYLESAYVISKHLLNGDLIEFIISIFNERSWRPVIFQLFIVPFLVITNGDLLNSVLLTHVLFVSLSVFFTYKIFLKFSNKYISSLCASIICLSVDIFFGGDSFTLFAEISFIPFLLATFYYLSDPKLFQNKRKSNLFALFFTLTLLSRPVEGFLFLVTSLIFILFYQHREYLSYNEIFKGLTYPVFFAWLLFLSRLVPDVSSSVLKIDPPHSYEIFFLIFCVISITLFFLLLINFILKRNFSLKKNNKVQNFFFSKVMLYSSFVLWFWYTPRFGSLYGWVYETSIGNQFQHQKDNSYEFIELINRAFASHGVLIIYILLFLFTISILVSLKNNKKTILNIFRDFNILILTAIPMPLILYFTTFQVTYRKIAPVITLLLILFLINIISNYKIKKLSNIFLISIFFIQILFVYKNIYSSDINDKWMNQVKDKNLEYILGTQFPIPINSLNNPHESLVNFLSKEATVKNLNSIALVMDDSAYPVEPYLAKFLCKIKSLHCSFSSPKQFKYGNIDYLDSNDALLIIHSYSDVDNNSNKNIDLAKKKIVQSEKRSSPSELYSYYMQYLYLENNLSIHNINKVECYSFYKEYKACLLIKD